MFSLQNEIGNLRASVDKRVDVVQGEISQLWGSVEKWSASMQDEVFGRLTHMEAQVAAARADTAALNERMTLFHTAVARDLNRSRKNGRDVPYMVVPALTTGKDPEGVPLLITVDSLLSLSDDQLRKYDIIYGLHIEDKMRNASKVRQQALAQYIGCPIEMEG